MALALMANNLTAQSDYDGDLERRERAAEFARRAIHADPNEPWGHGLLGYCLTWLRRLPEARVHFERAAELNPNDVFMAMMHAQWFVYMGQVERGLAHMEYALTRDPLAHDWFWDAYSMALVVAGRYDEALRAFDKMAMPPPWSYVPAAIAHVNLGNVERARDLLLRCREANPQSSPEDYVRFEPYVDPAVPERLIADLSKAL
jgi:tetratricopeptide (TPR) repeat protein